MRTKEERLLDVIGDTKDRNVLAAVGHENADPQMKTDVHHVEFREVPKLPEKDVKRMRIRNAILGGFAAAVAITGGVVLWNNLRDNVIEPTSAESTTAPVVTVGTPDVSSIIDDMFANYTDAAEWGITIEPVAANSSGVKIIIRQSGGSPSGVIRYSYGHSIQKLTDGEWKLVDTQYGDYLESTLYPDSQNEEYCSFTNFLEPGRYRIAKTFDDFRGAGDFDLGIAYAEFDIPEISDSLSVITDLSMPEPFAPPTDPLVYDSADMWHDEFNDIWQKRFTSIDVELIQLIDNERAEDLLAQYQEAQIADIQAGNVTRYSIDDTPNVYRFMKELGLSGEEMEDILKEHDEGLRKEISEGRNLEDHLFDLYTMYFGSENKSDMAATFKSPYAIVVGECVFSPRWLYYHAEADYTKAGITATQVEIMLPLYEKLGLTDEAWAAFSAKLTGFIEENKKPEEKRRYIIDNSVDFQITSDEAIKILEDNFYGTWKRTPATGGDYDTLTFTYNYDYEERTLMGFDFDFEGFHRPFAIGETDDIWYMECINSGESEVFVIEKSEPKVMYCTGLIYYNGFDSSPAVDLSEDWVSRYEYEETLIDKTVRPGEISVLGLDKLINIYGADFEQFFRESIEQGFDTDDGKHYVPGDDMMTAKSRHYLVTRDENSVTLGIRFYEQTEYESYLNYEYPADDDGVEVLDDNDEPQPPTEHYFAVTFRKDENGWTFGYGQLSDVYADLPAQIYRSSQTDRYVTELTLNDVQLRGDEIIFQSGSLRINDTMEYGKTGITAETDSVSSAWIAGLDGHHTRTDIRLFNYALSDGRVLATVWLPAPGKSGWIVLMYCYDGETFKALRNGDGGLEPLVADIGDVRVEGDMIYVTWSADAAALAPNSGIPTGTTAYTISDSENSLIGVD
ncbi:MAG: hypothetical protein J6O50_11025 [Ruminiclostridium sp.]|nr:hypothetical protein [Ruminiclostridium sp.]